jgi:hypothetical protein
MFEVLSVRASLNKLKAALDKEEYVYFSRFGDGEINIMGNEGVSGHHHYSEALSNELRLAINIEHPNYLIAASLGYEFEKGMGPGMFIEGSMEGDTLDKMRRIVSDCTNQKEFLNPILFHYLAAFDRPVLQEFIDHYIVPKKKMYVGSNRKSQMERVYGKIDYYMQTSDYDAYNSIDEIWNFVKENISKVDLFLPALGAATKTIAKRLWDMGATVNVIDIGSFHDAMDGLQTRGWIMRSELKPEDFKTQIEQTIFDNIDVHIPYKLGGNLGECYNDIMSDADDWVLFVDHDILLLRPQWYQCCIDAINQVGYKAGWISAVTNRIWCTDQLRAPAVDHDNIMEHIKFSNLLWNKHKGIIRKPTSGKPFSGFFILTHKEAWKKVGGFTDGFLGVDNDYYNKLLVHGYNTYIMPGVYSYHIYRNKGAFE